MTIILLSSDGSLRPIRLNGQIAKEAKGNDLASDWYGAERKWRKNIVPPPCISGNIPDLIGIIFLC